MKKLPTEAIVLVDPVSTGRYLKDYVLQSGRKVIAVFTLSQSELLASGKFIPYDEKVSSCAAVIHTRQFTEALSFIEDLPYKVVAVIPASEPAVELADQIAQALGLAGNAVRSSTTRRDKYEMRRALQAAGLDGPAYATCSSLAEALAFAQDRPLPVMVKTPRGAGAHHVFTCRSLEEIKQAYEIITSEANIFGVRSPTALLEEYLSGQQYLVELLADGRQLHFVCVWRLSFDLGAHGSEVFRQADMVTDSRELHALWRVIRYAQDVASAVDIDWGPCLVELRDDPIRGPLLIEVGARIAGIDLPVLSRQASSLDLFQETLRVYTEKESFSMPEITYKAEAALVFCTAQGSGKVQRINGMEGIYKLPSFLAAKLGVSEGEIVGRATDLATIPLYVYLTHKDAAQLATDVATARLSFSIDFETVQ